MPDEPVVHETFGGKAPLANDTCPDCGIGDLRYARYMDGPADKCDHCGAVFLWPRPTRD